MKLAEAYPSTHLAHTDIPDGEDLIVTINDAKLKTVGQGEDAEEKLVLSFSEQEKTLILNKTNATTIANLYGDETDDWSGKKIALFATEVEFKGKQVLGIRVRLKKPKPAAAANGNGTAKRRAYEEDDE